MGYFRAVALLGMEILCKITDDDYCIVYFIKDGLVHKARKLIVSELDNINQFNSNKK